MKEMNCDLESKCTVYKGVTTASGATIDIVHGEGYLRKAKTLYMITERDVEKTFSPSAFSVLRRDVHSINGIPVHDIIRNMDKSVFDTTGSEVYLEFFLVLDKLLAKRCALEETTTVSIKEDLYKAMAECILLLDKGNGIRLPLEWVDYSLSELSMTGSSITFNKVTNSYEGFDGRDRLCGATLHRLEEIEYSLCTINKVCVDKIMDLHKEFVTDDDYPYTTSFLQLAGVLSLAKMLGTPHYINLKEAPTFDRTRGAYEDLLDMLLSGQNDPVLRFTAGIYNNDELIRVGGLALRDRELKRLVFENKGMSIGGENVTGYSDRMQGSYIINRTGALKFYIQYTQPEKRVVETYLVDNDLCIVKVIEKVVKGETVLACGDYSDHQVVFR